MRQAQEMEMSGEQYANEENQSVNAEFTLDTTLEQNQYGIIEFKCEQRRK